METETVILKNKMLMRWWLVGQLLFTETFKTSHPNCWVHKWIPNMVGSPRPKPSYPNICWASAECVNRELNSKLSGLSAHSTIYVAKYWIHVSIWDILDWVARYLHMELLTHTAIGYLHSELLQIYLCWRLALWGVECYAVYNIVCRALNINYSLQLNIK